MMRAKNCGIALSAATLANVVLTSGADAGTVVLISDTYDYVCHVDVTTGTNAPNTPVSNYNGVGRGRVASGQDKLCYRRSGIPDDCNSSMTEWRCDGKITSGEVTFSLR